jgi:hypothetical protein
VLLLGAVQSHQRGHSKSRPFEMYRTTAKERHLALAYFLSPFSLFFLFSPNPHAFLMKSSSVPQAWLLPQS